MNISIPGAERRVQHQQGAPQHPDSGRPAVLQPKLHRELRRPAVPGASPPVGHPSSLPPSLSVSSGQNNAQHKITGRIFSHRKQKTIGNTATEFYEGGKIP